MQALRLVIFGAGRAGGSIALAAERAGHTVSAIVPGPSAVLRPELAHFDAVDVDRIPGCDILFLTVPDDALVPVVRRLQPGAPEARVVAHASGFTSHEVLAPLRSPTTGIGSMHPVQSLPDPASGSAALAGSVAAISGDRTATVVLLDFARSLGMEPFLLDDRVRALHHAAASAASNFVAAALVVARELASRAGVPLDAYARLTEQTIAHVDAAGSAALTGPVARGDTGTVGGQLAAIARAAPELLEPYAAFVRATAALTSHREVMDRVVEEHAT